MNELQNILEKSEYIYEIIEHDQPIRSREDGKKYFGIEVGQTAPTLILKTDKGFFAFIISGKRERFEFDAIAEIIGCTKVKLASPKEVQEITGFEVGSVRMVGLSLPCVLDKELFSYDFVYGGTGQPTFTLKIEPKALEELNQVIAIFS